MQDKLSHDICIVYIAICGIRCVYCLCVVSCYIFIVSLSPFFPNMTQILPYKIYLNMMLGGKCFLYFVYVNVFKYSFLYTSLGPASTNLILEL